MSGNSLTQAQAKKKSVMEQLTLTYYNDLLYEKGIITRHERSLMQEKIRQRGRAAGTAW